MFDLLSWLPWVGGASTIGLIVLALFAPSVLQVAAAWLTALSPLLKGIAEGIVNFIKVLWEGLKDMADNLSSIIFVLVIAGLAALWGYHSRPCECPEPVECSTTQKPKRIPLPARPSSELENFFKFDWLPF
jgi:uncharacterized membrane protein